ncbi:hypothetical protein B0H12DRAFT_1111259 [Mycena haematopus]|nr:hypothetical protein B0H12DRAFT_1111259 [Mycena haematopus]
MPMPVCAPITTVVRVICLWPGIVASILTQILGKGLDLRAQVTTVVGSEVGDGGLDVCPTRQEVTKILTKG